MSEQFSLNEAIYNCRAMRRIKSDEVPEEVLLELIDAANQAPSGSNTQNARWIVVRDPKSQTGTGRLESKAWRALHCCEY